LNFVALQIFFAYHYVKVDACEATLSSPTDHHQLGKLGKFLQPLSELIMYFQESYEGPTFLV